MGDNEVMDFCKGIPDKGAEEKAASEYKIKMKNELDKISMEEKFGHNLKAVYRIQLIIDKECNCKIKIPPEYRIYVNGMDSGNMHRMIDDAVHKFVDDERYYFHYYYNQLPVELTRAIEKHLKDSDGVEYWCRLHLIGKTILGKTSYLFIVLMFDKAGLDIDLLYDGTRHVFWSNLHSQWSYSRNVDIDEKIICYNELFRRAASLCDVFLRVYGDDFNMLSAMEYEREQNIGSIIATKDSKIGENAGLQMNYDICLNLEQPVKLEAYSYKKIRKLLEITKTELSLIMNENGEIYAIGRLIENPTCEYYKVQFEGCFKWTIYKNNKKFFCYRNMIPCIPNKKVGIGHADISLLRETFGITETFKIEKIIEKAITQKHGTMVVFTENAKEETYRLRKSGMPVLPIDITLEETLIKSLTSIDGALICDIKGICYSIGVILDGETSDKADLSRGARYNSAIRYIEQQRKNDKKTFIVIVSEDGYVNCLSSAEKMD